MSPTPRQAEILAIIQAQQPISRQDLLAELGGGNTNTLQTHLYRMRQSGYIHAHPCGQHAMWWSSIPEPLTAPREAWQGVDPMRLIWARAQLGVKL